MNAAATATTTTTIIVLLIITIHIKRDKDCNGNERDTRERTTREGGGGQRFKIICYEVYCR